MAVGLPPDAGTSGRLLDANVAWWPHWTLPDPRRQPGCGDLLPSARLTTYEPGVDRLAFTAAECDALRERTEALPDVDGAAGHKFTLLDPDADRWVFERTMGVLSAANAAWWRFKVDPALASIQVLRFRAGQGLALHTDALPTEPNRKLSLVVMLSKPSDYRGGELLMVYAGDPTLISPKRGTVAVFPSTIAHTMNTVTQGERLMMTAYLNGPAPT